MQPVRIPEETWNRWHKLGWQKAIIGAPEGLEERVYPVEAIVGLGELGPEFNMLIEISEEDWGILEMNGRRFWLVVSTPQLNPFRLVPYGLEGSNEAMTDEEISEALEAYAHARQASLEGEAPELL